MLSADVDAGLDPIYASVSEKNNASMLGKGIGMCKYTGSRGKSGASDANAEYVAEIRKMLEENNILYQISELGKVDVGGGGTIAYIFANKGIDVIDCATSCFSGGTSQPSTETMFYALQQYGIETGLDESIINKVNDYFKLIKQKFILCLYGMKFDL